MKKIPTLYTENGERELPFKWEICGHCSGHGTSSAYLGAFTREALDEQGDEWVEDYMAGRFDRACEHCEGGKVRVADESRMSKEDIAEFAQQEQEAAECEAEHRAERMMEWFDY